MKTYLTIFRLSIILFVTSLSAQDVDFEWAAGFGGVSNDDPHSMVVDASGNIYTIGVFTGTVDFDPGVGTHNLVSNGSSDCFIQKLDPSGNFLWAKSFGGLQYDSPLSLSLDTAENIVITGSYSGSFDFDPGSGTTILTSNGFGDIFISKFDSNGNFIWAKSIGGVGTEYGKSIDAAADGYIYVTGGFSSLVDFDPGNGTHQMWPVGVSDIFILKLDGSGNFIWANNIGSPANDAGSFIKADSIGNLYVAGYFTGAADFDMGPGSFVQTGLGSNDIFILKTDTSGGFIWARHIGGTGNDNINEIAFSPTGLYAVGTYNNIVDFDPGTGVHNLGSNGSSDMFILKLNLAGDFQWAQSIGGTGYDVGQSISLDYKTNSYITGIFINTVDFDPGFGVDNITAVGPSDAFILKLDSLGNYIWAKSLSSTNNISGKSITVDQNSNIHCIGSFYLTADFDPDTSNHYLTSNGSSDVFVLKLSQCTESYGTATELHCMSYTVPSGDETYTNVGNYIVSDTITNTCGSDSIITINLTIYPTYNDTTSIAKCRGENFTYADGSISNNILVNESHTSVLSSSNGCDSLVTEYLLITAPDTSVTQNLISLTANLNGANYQWLDCQNGYAMLPGQTSQSYTALVNGAYAVEITDSGCVDTSSCYSIVAVSMAEQALSNQITVYPNPTNGPITLLLQTGQNGLVIIKSADGKIIQEHKIIGDKLNLWIPGSKGIYFVEILTDDGKNTLKVLKK